MRKYMAVLLGCLFVIISMTSAFADISSPTVYCDGKKVSARDIVEFDIADADDGLTIKWNKQTGASTYSYKCIGLNEVPDFEDTNQATSENTIKHGENTSDRTFTVSKTKLKKYDYLKIAVGVFDSNGNERWCNFGVKLTNSDLIVKAPDVKCDGYTVDSQEIVDYDLADGSLTIKWTPQTAAKKYEYSCVGLNEVPDFYDEDQGKEIKSGKVTSNTTSKCKFDLTKSKMQSYSYLKVTITAYDSDGEAYKTCFGIRLEQESESSLSLSKSSLSFAYKKDSASVTVSGVSSFTVSYPTEDETVAGKKWLTVTKSGSTINVEARANYGASARSETITVTSADGQTASIVVTQKAGYAAPTASIKIDKTYNSGDTYGPLANGGEDVLYLTVSVKNAQRIYVGTNNTTLGHKEVELDYSSTVTDHLCEFKIPAGLTPGIYPFTIYVSNSDVKDDQWAQSITPITLNVRVVGDTATGDDPYPAYGSTLLAVAQSQIGYVGSATSNNQTGANVTKRGDWTKYGAYTGANPDLWCASFVSWCAKQAGVTGINKSAGASPQDLCKNYTTQGAVVYFLDFSNINSTKHKTYLEKYGIKAERGDIEPAPGDLIFFRWKDTEPEYTFSHVGIVSKVEGGQVYYIDGNGTNDTVTERHRYLTDIEIAAFCKVTGTFATSTPTVETTFSGKVNDLTVRLGEKAQLTGTVNLQGNTSIDRVTVNVRGYYDATDSRVLTRTFTDSLTTVKLENYSEFVVDTTVAPFNVAGSYTIRLWASAKDGTTLTQPIAEATVLVAEPVTVLPSYTVDDLAEVLKVTLAYNESKNDYGCVHNDGKSVAIGLIQWNANAGRALPLLKNIVAKNPEDAHAILGEALYQEIANNPKGYWTRANRTFDSDEKSRVSKLLKTSYGIETQDEQIESDLTNKNLKSVRDCGVTDPWAIVYFADIINVGSWLNNLIDASVAEVGSVDKITLDVAHKVTQAHSTYSQYSSRLKYTYEYLKGITFDGKHYNDSATTTPDDTSHQYALLGGYIDYIPGQDYFTESKTKECTGNNSVSGGTCKSIEYDYAYQCAGFAKYVEMKIYGKYGDYLDGKESDLLTHANVTVDSLKQLIQRAGLGANVRAGATSDSGATTGVGHSMIVTAISDTGFDVIHCNWDNCCGISTKTWTWESFKTWLDKKGYGIEKIRVHNPVEDSDPTKAKAPEFHDYTAFTVTDFDWSEGYLYIVWDGTSAIRRDEYYVKAILLNEVPVVGDSSQADRAVKTVMDGMSSYNFIWLSTDELTGAQYLKFAVGAAVEGQEGYTWSWVGFKLNGTFASSEADMLLPASLTAIEDEAFYGLPMSSVYCPDGLKSIGAKAFANCTSLRKVRIPASVTQIDASAFNGCTNLLIFGTKGSTAETFAKEHNFTFIAE